MNLLFIGRFQPFHNGHLKVLSHSSKRYTEIIIGIGSSQYAHTIENPFSAEERKQMIQETLQQYNIGNYRIVLIPDIHDLPRWVDHVCSLVSNFEVVLSNNPLTKQLFTEKGYQVQTTPIFSRKVFSGKEIRRRMMAGEPWENLVPAPVAALIHTLDGVQRIQQLMHQ